MRHRWTTALVALAALAVGLAVGWLVLGGGSVKAEGDTLIADSTLATAVGTLVLASATFYLGVKTRAVVDVGQEQVRAAREDIAVGREQAETAQAALAAQTQPFLTVGAVNDKTFAASVWTVPPGRPEAAATGHLRNAGIGTAIVKTTLFVFSESSVFAGGAVDPAVPPGETTAVGMHVADSDPRYDEAVDCVTALGTYSIAVEYGDVSGQTRGAVRLDVHQRPHGGAWYVRQVFWADTLDEVRTNPRFGTQPAD